jgi:hypothetical protein
MRRPLFGVILALLTLAAVSQAMAAPQNQETKPVIAQPESGATVRGVVQVVGTATHPQFQRYELYYAPWPVPGDNAWTFIGPDAHFQQQPLGLLGTWDSRAVPDGQYALKVRVVRKDANYVDSEPRQVVVANTKAAESPTPSASPTSTETPTPEGPVATLAAPTAAAVATVPPGNKPSQAPTATKIPPAAGGAAGATPVASSATSDPASLMSGASKLFNGGRLIGTAKTAAELTIAAFVALGLFFGVKGLLTWLWFKIRP